jgi:hypothetical protein
MIENNARNQHFVTQAEQRLNAMNPHADARHMRIYSFEVVDRENYTLALESGNGRAIGTNLSLFDLFSFDVPDGGSVRHNFESLFHKYEKHIAVHPRSLLAKLNADSKDIKAEIIDLFTAKLLNFVRSPFCIPKVLNTFPGLAAYDPTDPGLLTAYRRIVSGKKPHQAHLCAELGISSAQYVEWLRVLFMLLTPVAEGQPNFFESMIKILLENRKTYIATFVFEYDSAQCLLSDRGFRKPIEDGLHMSFSFNICSIAFVDFIFADLATLVQGKASPEFVARAISSWESLPEKQLNITFIHNNLDVLARYNRRVIQQCYRRVYCSAKDGLVLSAPGIAVSPLP